MESTTSSLYSSATSIAAAFLSELSRWSGVYTCRHAAQCVRRLPPHTLTRRACSSGPATHARHADVVQHVLAVEVEALGDLYDALGAEGALGVEDQRTTLATCERGSLGVCCLQWSAGRQRLGRHCEGEAELALADAVLAEDLPQKRLAAGGAAEWFAERCHGWAACQRVHDRSPDVVGGGLGRGSATRPR
eukprot:scaffold70974_cov63-Phaeocystis_antarctica.AAC.3